ncbi:MAG: M15 family metallopeptidase [Treponema sp.]|nr:M15 family metallopeptidase [Treponema sp.]
MKYFKMIFAAAVTAAFMSGCSKKAYAAGTVKETSEMPVIKVNPEYEKINRVYEKMSERFKTEIQISEKTGEKDAFLSDLKIVLEEEKKYNPNDVPLYYLIDKKHNIGENYIPDGLVKLTDKSDYNFWRDDLSLRPDAESALRVMARAAKADGITLLVSSTYRSYEYQKKLFQRWVDIDGLEEAERESARAGTSQHQLGLAIDFGSIDDSFAETKMGKWMYENAASYGWSLSFPKNYEDITGYRWESWHFRFVGVPACNFQKKYFNDVQQYMLEFIDAWKNDGEE